MRQRRSEPRAEGRSLVRHGILTVDADGAKLDASGSRYTLRFGKGRETSPHAAFYYYHLEQLQAVRAGPWKVSLALDRKPKGLRGRRAQHRLGVRRVPTPPRWRTSPASILT